MAFTFEDRGIKGPDVSFYQGNPKDGLFINFQKMKDYGVNFVIVKAGQHTWRDPAFDYNWKEAKRVGLPRASYFFLDKDGDGKAQAELYWQILKDDPGEGPLVVDFEWGSGEWDGLYAFLVRIRELSGYHPERIWIYTGKYYWIDHGPKTQAEKLWFLRHPLWLAVYNSTLEAEDVPYPWLEPVMWQKGTTIVWGPDLGVHSLELDWNIFNGGIELFNRYFTTNYIPPQPEETGGNEVEYKVVWTKGVARRTGPKATGDTWTGHVYSYPQIVEVIEENIPDALDPTDPDKKWVKFSDGLFGASRYPDSIGVARDRLVKVEEPTPEPEPEPTPCENENFVLKVDGFKEISGTLECE
jgi:GH25 family lysozyme M1 (1,4-beta-N-acetylmuramidase)